MFFFVIDRWNFACRGTRHVANYSCKTFSLKA